MQHQYLRGTFSPSVTSLVLLTASLLVSLLLCEVILRIFGYYPPLKLEWIFRNPSAEVPNRDLILIPPELLLPSFYRIDPRRQTIIAIGDSFTAGYPVKPQDSYPAVLER